MPTRSASRSISREKFNCCCAARPCPPTSTALPKSVFLLAAIAPKSKEPIITGCKRCCLTCKRAIWRCVTWLISCAKTLANSSARSVTPMVAKCKPNTPPGTAKAFTLVSAPCKTRQGKRPIAGSTLPLARPAAIRREKMPSTYSTSRGSSK